MKKKALSLVLALVMCLGMLSMSALAVTPSTGSFGENVTWTLENSGTLFVRGTGDMYNYSANTAPWNKNRTAVKEIIIESGVTSIGDYTFMSCDALSTVRIPASVTRIGKCAFGFSGLTSVTIPNGVTEIERQTFNSCTKLSTVNIPEGVKVIGSGAFYNCTSLTEIVLPNSITNIEQIAFRDCNNLSSISIGDQVVEIGRHVFANCRSLTSFTVPKGITTIDAGTFYGCTGLEKITIPVNVTSIKGSAFADCNKLTDVYFKGSETKWMAVTIYANNGPLSTATIHYNSGGAQPVAKDFTYTPPQNLTYDGSSTTAAVRAAVTSSIHSGCFTLAFTDGQNNPVTDLVKPGTYHVLAQVTAHGSYGAGEVSLGSVTITESPGLHGKISLSFGDKQSSSGVAYVPGDVVITIHATPDPGYQLSIIRVIRDDNGQQVPVTGSGNIRTFRMPAADVSIQAEFSVR